MAPPRSWLITRSTDFAPNGTLQLGQILLDPLSPQSILFHHVDTPQVPIESTTWQNVRSRRTETSSTSVEVPLPSHLSHVKAGISSEKALDLHVDRLVSMVITPSSQYIQTVIQKPEVKEAIRRFRFRAKLYMVTGVRVAEGVRLESPIGLGDGKVPGLGAVASRDSSPFVMAYRLHEIAFSTKFGRILVRDKKNSSTGTKLRAFDSHHGLQLHDTVDPRAYSSVMGRDSSPVSKGGQGTLADRGLEDPKEKPVESPDQKQSSAPISITQPPSTVNVQRTHDHNSDSDTESVITMASTAFTMSSTTASTSITIKSLKDYLGSDALDFDNEVEVDIYSDSGYESGHESLGDEFEAPKGSEITEFDDLSLQEGSQAPGTGVPSSIQNENATADLTSSANSQDQNSKMSLKPEQDTSIFTVDRLEDVYSEVAYDISTEAYIMALAQELHDCVLPSHTEGEGMDSLLGMLPDLLRDFALRIGAEHSAQINLDSMYFIHKYRL